MALTFNQVKPTTVSQEQVPAPKNETGMANVTIRVDADCFLLCDGEFMEEIEIVANQIKKAQLPIGQHILEFIDATNPDVKLEKEVDFPEDGKNYLVLIKGLQEAGSKAKENAAKAEAEKQMRLEAERKAQEEAVRKAKEEAERKAKEEAERKAKETVRKAKEEAERKAKEAVRKAKEEAERKAKEAERKAKEAERKAKEEAERKAKEEAERKAQEEAELKAKQKTMEVQVTGLRSYSDGLFKDCTIIRVECKPENRKSENIELRMLDVELVLIDILTDKRSTVRKSVVHCFNSLEAFTMVVKNSSLPSKFKCQAIIRWKGNVIAMSEFYDLVRK